MKDAVLRVSGLHVHYSVSRGFLRRSAVLRAVDGVDFELAPGEALGVVGESGSGKSTLARAVLHLVRPTSGEVVWLGRSVESLSAAELRPLRRETQIVFQEPFASLDPRLTVREAVGEPLRAHLRELDAASREPLIAQMLARVGLGAELMSRYPHELSGGQCQRVAIARAMILRPKLLVCDEPVSRLDVSIQAQIVNLLADLKREHGLAILFISHDLALVRHLCERVLVMYLGRMVELAPADELCAEARHPYTRALLAAVPDFGQRVVSRAGLTSAGEPPSPLAPPSGCFFRTRCPHAIERCALEAPRWEEAGTGRHVACHRWREIGAEPAGVPALCSPP